MTSIQRSLAILLPILLCLACSPSSAPPARLAPAATIEVYAVLPTNGPNVLTMVDAASGATVYLATPPIVSAGDVLTVSRNDQTPGQPSLGVQLNPAGAAKMTTATTPPSGQRVAFVANGRLVGTPAIRAPISDSLVISSWTKAEDRDAIYKSLIQ